MNPAVFLVPILAAAVGASALSRGETGSLLATLRSRCQRMLYLQTAVLNDTKGLHQVIEGNAARKLHPEGRRAALKLAADETAIIKEATKAIAVLEAQGAAVAFPEVFHQLRKDMEIVQRRLMRGDVGRATQDIEQDIIDTLDEMLKSLEKR